MILYFPFQQTPQNQPFCATAEFEGDISGGFPTEGVSIVVSFFISRLLFKIQNRIHLECPLLAKLECDFEGLLLAAQSSPSRLEGMVQHC